MTDKEINILYSDDDDDELWFYGGLFLSVSANSSRRKCEYDEPYTVDWDIFAKLLFHQSPLVRLIREWLNSRDPYIKIGYFHNYSDIKMFRIIPQVSGC